MSVEALTAALKIQGLKPTEKLILVILANYADENGSCYPSHQHLADIVGLKDHKGVQKIIRQFAERGLLTIEPRYNASGGQTSNRYHLKINQPPHRLSTPPPTVVTTPNTKEDTKDNLYTYEFLEFWSHYPRKINKHEAAKAFRSICRSKKMFNLIVEATIIHREQCKRRGIELQFIPHATTWLRGRRFEEVEESVNPQKRPPGQIAG